MATRKPPRRHCSRILLKKFPKTKHDSSLQKICKGGRWWGINVQGRWMKEVVPWRILYFVPLCFVGEAWKASGWLRVAGTGCRMYTASVRDSQAVLTLISSTCKETEINTVPVILGKRSSWHAGGRNPTKGLYKCKDFLTLYTVHPPPVLSPFGFMAWQGRAKQQPALSALLPWSDCFSGTSSWFTGYLGMSMLQWRLFLPLC